MTDALLIPLPDYVRSIDLLLDEWELREKGYEISTYFDAAEIRDALLGAEALVSGENTKDITIDPKLISERFEHPRTLVRMLFSAGSIGSVRLLPPHQSELLSLITFDFASRDKESFARAVERLREAIAESPESSVPSSDLVTSARQTAEQSMRMFKLAEAERSPWSRRLSRWKAAGILDLETITPDFATIIESREFGTLERALAAKRERWPRNNFSDAAAVMTVANALEKTNQKASRHLPLLYLAPGVLHDAVLATDVRHKLRFKLHDDRSISVIRDWKYMVVRATMVPAETAVGHPPPTQVNDLRKLRNQLRQIDTTRQRISELLITLNIGDGEVTERVDTLFDLCFFKNVWQPYSSAVASADAALISDALEQVRSTLEKNVAEYSRLDDLWKDVHGAAVLMHDRILARPIDFIRAFGAFRFLPPPDVCDRAAVLLKEIVAEVTPAPEFVRANTNPAGNAIARVIVLYERAKGRSIGGDDLGVLAIVLWSLELDHLVDQVLVPFTGGDWMAVLHAASQLRSDSAASIVDGVVERLKRAVRSAATGEERVRMAIAIGYLSFHLALRRGYEPFWDRRISRLAPSSDRSTALVHDATKCAREAAKLTENLSSLLHVYALNQSLYYLVASGAGTRDDLRDFSNQLLRYADNPELWDYRYDDTMARYFFWASATAPQPERKRELAEIAKQHIEHAVAASHGDREVARFRSILENYRDELYSAQMDADTGSKSRPNEAE